MRNQVSFQCGGCKLIICPNVSSSIYCLSGGPATMKKLRHIKMTLFLAVMMQENYSPNNGEKSFFDQTKLRPRTFYP